MKAKLSYSLVLFLSIITALTFLTCRKVDLSKKTMISTSTVENVTQTTATAKGHIIDLSESNSHSEYGFCWDTLSDPFVTRYKISLGAAEKTGDYSKSISGLRGGKNYYLRAYVKNDDSYIYGKSVTFTTPDPLPPTLTTTVITNVTDTTAMSGGHISFDGGANIVSRGICWATTQNPTLTNSYITSGADTGTFTSKIKNFSLNATYYVRAFAINKAGTGYGNQVSFNSNPDLPVVTTNTVTNISYTSATCGGNVITDGGATVTARGVCWSTSLNPIITGNHTTDGTGTGNFISNLSGLSANTTYYVKAYATNSKGTVYGNEIIFSTNAYGLPVLTTNIVTNITTNSATSGGIITADGGQNITARGVCWSTSQNPTITDSYTTDGANIGAFTSNITGLLLNTTYYVRAYATNSNGTSYGNQVSVSTLNGILTLTTTAISNITTNSASSGGNISNDGGLPVTVRGVCWSTSQNPVATDSHTTDGIGIGSFTSSIINLTLGTTYYIRAYAINSQGTYYGNQISFTTIIPNCGTVTDYDGNTYNTVLIGTQCWMKENLKTTKYADNTPLVDGTSAGDITGNYTSKYYFDYDNTPSNKIIYGKLYTWAAVMNGAPSSTTNPSDVQGVCPTGWHVPSDAEWSQLTDNLGGESVAGGKMKEMGTTHWTSPNTGADNSSGFTGLPGGIRGDDGTFYSIGNVGYFWSTTQGGATPSTNAWSRSLSYNNASVTRYVFNHKTYGYSVRCIKN